MTNLNLATNLVDQFFSEMAASYCNKDLEMLISHYTSEPDLLFWNAEGDTITSHDQLTLWYEELFRQFDIKSVNYRVEKLHSDERTIIVGSLWVLSTLRKLGAEPLEEEQSLRATHLFKRRNGQSGQSDQWFISHLHVSPTHFLPD